MEVGTVPPEPDDAEFLGELRAVGDRDSRGNEFDMEEDFIKYISVFFKTLIDIYGFNIKREVNDGQSYSIEYNSDIVGIKLEKYRREFYVTLYKLNRPDREINLFNLLDYVNQTKSKALESNYFRDEKNIEAYYRKQLNYISEAIYDNYNVIKDFFSSNNYESKVADLEMYIIKKHPELFRRT